MRGTKGSTGSYIPPLQSMGRRDAEILPVLVHMDWILKENAPCAMRTNGGTDNMTHEEKLAEFNRFYPTPGQLRELKEANMMHLSMREAHEWLKQRQRAKNIARVERSQEVPSNLPSLNVVK